MDRAREDHKDLYMCVIDYKKAFDCVDRETLWVIIRDMGVPVHMIVFLRRLYTNQEATVRTAFGETENIDIGKGASEKAGLFLHVGKTKMMTTGDIGEVTISGENIEVVTKFVSLGALITKDGLCEKEVGRIIAMGKAAMGRLTSIWKDRGVTLVTKVKLVKVLVFPIVLYGAETWTMRKHERNRRSTFELWCRRRELRVSWKERKTNIWIIENIKPEWKLE